MVDPRSNRSSVVQCSDQRNWDPTLIGITWLFFSKFNFQSGPYSASWAHIQFKMQSEQSFVAQQTFCETKNFFVGTVIGLLTTSRPYGAPSLQQWNSPFQIFLIPHSSIVCSFTCASTSTKLVTSTLLTPFAIWSLRRSWRNPWRKLVLIPNGTESIAQCIEHNNSKWANHPTKPFVAGKIACIHRLLKWKSEIKCWECAFSVGCICLSTLDGHNTPAHWELKCWKADADAEVNTIRCLRMRTHTPINRPQSSNKVLHGSFDVLPHSLILYNIITCHSAPSKNSHLSVLFVCLFAFVGRKRRVPYRSSTHIHTFFHFLFISFGSPIPVGRMNIVFVSA